MNGVEPSREEVSLLRDDVAEGDSGPLQHDDRRAAIGAQDGSSHPNLLPAAKSNDTFDHAVEGGRLSTAQLETKPALRAVDDGMFTPPHDEGWAFGERVGDAIDSASGIHGKVGLRTARGRKRTATGTWF